MSLLSSSQGQWVSLQMNCFIHHIISPFFSQIKLSSHCYPFFYFPYRQEEGFVLWPPWCVCHSQSCHTSCIRCPHPCRLQIQLAAGKSLHIHQSLLWGYNDSHITEWNYDRFFSPETNFFHKFWWLHFLSGPERPQRSYLLHMHATGEVEDTAQALVAFRKAQLRMADFTYPY